jgi:SAM-dependent methyltransferase
MLGRRDEFEYLECQACGCLQLVTPPQDIEKYYPSGYTGFQSRVSRAGTFDIPSYLRARRNRACFGSPNWFDRLLLRRAHLPLKALARLGIHKQARILDVGCGAGFLLNDLRELGYEELLGVDRFVPDATGTGHGVGIVKGELQDVAHSKWDVIMFHHSFEHMPDPGAVLQLVAQMLESGGHCLIRIPVVGWAWRHYGTNWVQIDAPRHFFLHSETSFRLVVDHAALAVREVTYDSNELQFWGSELYARDVTLASVNMKPPRELFSKSRLRRYRRDAEKLNADRTGDSAVFDLVRV